MAWCSFLQTLAATWRLERLLVCKFRQIEKYGEAPASFFRVAIHKPRFVAAVQGDEAGLLCVFIENVGAGLHHAAHTAHALVAHWHIGLLFFLVADDTLGGEEHTCYAGSVFESYAGYLGGVNHAFCA